MGGRGNFSGGTTRTTAHTISKTGIPNSRVIQYINGKKHMERRYGADGLPDEDIDYTDHGNPKKTSKGSAYASMGVEKWGEETREGDLESWVKVLIRKQ